MNERSFAWPCFLFAHLALLVVAEVLATCGLFPSGLFQPPIDKIGHLFAYGVLTFLALRSFGGRRRWPVVLTLLVLATIDEFSQRAFKTRTFDLGDLAMNVVGICAFAVLAGGWRTGTAER